MAVLWRIIGVLAIAAAIAGCGEAHAPNAVAAQLPPSSQPILSGRVVDDSGHAVADCDVFVTTTALGDNIESAMRQTPMARTDRQGRFAMRLPYAGLLYDFCASNGGDLGDEQSCVVDHDQSIALRVPAAGEIVEPESHVSGDVCDAAGRPAAGVSVSLVDPVGHVVKGTTDSSGAFAFTGFSVNGEAVVLAAGSDNTMAVQACDPSYPPPLHLKLAAPATVRGKVVDDGDGRSLAAVRVTMRPSLTGAVEFHATTDAAGDWRIVGVPPGGYFVVLDSADYFDLSMRGVGGGPPNMPRHTIDPGTNPPLDFRMQRKAQIRGVVVDSAGRPIAGALVSAAAGENPDGSVEYTLVDTNASGRFVLATGFVDIEQSIEAAHGQYGAASITVPPPGPGGVSPELRFVLPGLVRLRGVVRFPDGKPAADVECNTSIAPITDVVKSLEPFPALCGGTWTDAQGRFDFGLITLPPTGTCAMLTIGHRPTAFGDYDAVPFEHSNPDVPLIAGADGRFYFAPRQPIPATPGQTVTLAIKLQEDRDQR